jgi:hypothetical protein
MAKEMTAEQKAKFSKVGKSNVRTAKAHERRVAKLLKEWSGKEFRRRRVEGRGDDVKVVEGVADVIPVEGDILFAIEAKKGQGFSLDALMADPVKARFTDWWHQATYDAKIWSEKIGSDRYPMLFFKPDPQWDWVAIPQTVLRFLRAKGDNLKARLSLWFPHLAFNGYVGCGLITKNVSRSKKNPVMVPLRLEDVFLCRWRDFASNVDPESIFVQT